MKKYLVLLLTLLVSTFSLNSFAFTAPPKPADNTYVLDQSGKLDSSQISKLNTKIESLNKFTKNEYAIVLLKTLDGADIADAAQDTFRAWGVGKANLNNGVMIMIATGERKTRIQTGKNAEGDLPDLLCNDILNNNLKPHLKKGDFYGGLDATLNAVSSHMESREKEKAVVAAPKEVPNAAPADVAATSQSNTGSSVGGILLVLLFGGVVVVGLIAFFSFRANRRREEKELENLRQERLAALERQMEADKRKAQQRLQDAKARTVATMSPPVVLPVPSHEPLKSASTTSHTARNVAVGAALGAAGLGAAALASAAVANKRDEDAAKRQREENARHRQEEENAAKRRREEDEAASRRRSEESTSSSWSSSSSSSSSSWDSGGSSGFGGGDSGGGGSSGDY